MADRLKHALRKTCQQIRKKLPPSYQHSSSAKICAQIRKLEQYRYAKRIAFYQAVHGEINLESLWKEAASQGKYCYFPTLNDNGTLSFLPATLTTTFQKNRFGIDEPALTNEDAITLNQLDLIFVPLVAFDNRGTRLGMGAGYYDRTLANSPHPLLIGVAYEYQREPYILAEPWDIPLDVVITETAIYWSYHDKILANEI